MGQFVKPVLTRGIRVLYSYFAWMRKYSKHPEKYPIELRYKKLHNLIKSVAHSFDIEYIVFGKENIPSSETCCFISNHISNFDPLAFLSVLDEPVAFVSKREVEKFPFVGHCCKDIDCLFMDRNDLKQSLKVMGEVQNDLANKNKNWLIFAEGTRNRDPLSAIRDMHHGTFRPAVRSGAVIVPVAIYGCQRILRKKINFKKFPVFVSFLPAISKEEYEKMTNQELAKMVHDQIQKELTFHLRPSDHEFNLKYNKKKYKFNQV